MRPIVVERCRTRDLIRIKDAYADVGYRLSWWSPSQDVLELVIVFIKGDMF